MDMMSTFQPNPFLRIAYAVINYIFAGIVLIIGILPIPSFAFQAEPIRILFTGDLMVHKRQLELAWDETTRQYDFTAQFQEITPYLKGDLVIGNFETVLGGGQKPYTGYPSFNSPDSLVSSLKKAGFNVLLLANNHILDQGPESALRTREILMQSGFAVTGIFPCEDTLHTKNAPHNARHAKPHNALKNIYPNENKTQVEASIKIPKMLLCNKNAPLFIDTGKAKIGILNYTSETNAARKAVHNKNMDINIIDFERIANDIIALQNTGAEIIIAAFHWGVEYELQPSDAQLKLAQFCFDRGVDLVIGSHPHVLQPLKIDYRGGKPQCAAWSLGNFISNQRQEPRERSIILAADFRRDILSATVYLERISVLPTVVEEHETNQKEGLRVVRAPKVHQFPPTPRQAKLDAINHSVLEMLSLPSTPASDGFYTFFERTPDIEQELFIQKCKRVLIDILQRMIGTAAQTTP